MGSFILKHQMFSKIALATIGAASASINCYEKDGTYQCDTQQAAADPLLNDPAYAYKNGSCNSTWIRISGFCIRGDYDSGQHAEIAFRLRGRMYWPVDGSYRDFREHTCTRFNAYWPSKLSVSPPWINVTNERHQELTVGSLEDDHWDTDALFATMSNKEWW